MRTTLILAAALLLVAAPVSAEEPEPEEGCSLVQTATYYPYVEVHPECVDEYITWPPAPHDEP
ncbi:MAG TPA: hypothetical protein VFH47_04565 [Candidatus Thermoplasmatota archaeon]|nr:hypothetical protein [Candidatus Thermoplasmatota archaeon]